MQVQVNLSFQEILTAQSGARYTVLQRLGQGGTAETSLVLATGGSYRGHLFALMVFRRISRLEWRDSFLREVAFLKICNHPAVMRVFDEGLHEEQRPFVVAEYLPRALAGELRVRPSMVAKLCYTLQLLSALEYLASPQIQVVHRDIKPANIFIKGGACVLGDFGLVKHLPTSADAEGDREMVKESIGPRMPRFYRTPDLVDYLNGGPMPTPASDVFQLGLVLAEVFSGSNPQQPMEGGDYSAPVRLAPIGYIPGGLGRSIKDTILPMLEMDRNTRPSVADLLPRWQELLLEAARQARALEGWVL